MVSLNDHYNGLFHNIVVTKDNGNIYIAYGEELLLKKQLGTEIVIYEHPITLFFANLFKRSLKIMINNKTYVVSKYSFKRHLKSLDLENHYNNILPLNYVDHVDVFLNLPLLTTYTRPLHQIISIPKRNQLSHKLFKAIYSEQTDKAIKLINKGANFDQVFYFKNTNNQLEFVEHPKNFKNGLFEIEKFYRVSVLAFAVLKENKKLYSFLYRIKKGELNNNDSLTLIKKVNSLQSGYYLSAFKSINTFPIAVHLQSSNNIELKFQEQIFNKKNTNT